jgi:hypothetical protein
MTQLPTVYIIHASDAPQHVGKLKEILFTLKTENRIGSITSLDEDYDFSAFNEKIEDGDLVITLLTNQLEPQKLRIENKLGALKVKRPKIKVAEIIVDNLTYENDNITFPSDLKPIRSREDMDGVWSGIEKSLKDMFPSKNLRDEPLKFNWSKFWGYVRQGFKVSAVAIKVALFIFVIIFIIIVIITMWDFLEDFRSRMPTFSEP